MVLKNFLDLPSSVKLCLCIRFLKATFMNCKKRFLFSPTLYSLTFLTSIYVESTVILNSVEFGDRSLKMLFELKMAFGMC